MAVKLVVTPELEALLNIIGESRVGHPTDGTRAFLFSKVMGTFDLVDGTVQGTQDVQVTLRLRSTADAKEWPYAVAPAESFDFSAIVGDQ